jgi:ferredoxin-NADP reductase
LPYFENSIIVASLPLVDHTFHPVRIRRVVQETADTRSFVLDVPDDLRAAFSYRAGQFCTFRIAVDGDEHIRCYSMSSAPEVDDELTVTVKRVPGGVVSNWMNESLCAGAIVEVAPPTGFFQLDDNGGDIVAFAAGSGITPVMSLLKYAVATTARRVRLLYANRDADSVIFASPLDQLIAAHPDRVAMVNRYDVVDGFLDAEATRTVLADTVDATCYVCGPTPFMDIVETALLDAAIPADRIHIERFTPATDPLLGDERRSASLITQQTDTPTRVTVELGGRTESTEHREGTTILQTARELGLSPPFSCESGSCATCMARLVEGEVSMRTNNALTDDEVADGWILTCQSVPTAATVHVVYE